MTRTTRGGCAALLVCAALLMAPTLVAAQQPAPQPIPAGFNFPTARATIDGWVASQNTIAERKHAWDLWAGMNAPAGGGLPIWESWKSDAEVFIAFGQKLLAKHPKSARHPFHQPVQFKHALKLKSTGALPAEQVVAFNKFDPKSAEFLAAQHAPPDGSHNLLRYISAADLSKLNGEWPASTKIADRKIEEFPVESVDTKPVFWLVKKSGLTPVPLWQGAASSTSPKQPVPETWTSCVLIDPAGQAATKLVPATREQLQHANPNAGLECQAKKYQYAPLSMLYSFALDADEAGAFNSAQGGGGTAVAGDFAVLVAMHVTSKEIVNWTWETFWWSGGASPPSRFPGSMDDQPATVKAPWSYYAMCTAYSMVSPATDPKGKPVVCFNPYLETPLPDGLDSNCMSCHGRARTPSGDPYPSTYLPNGYLDFGDPKIFGGTTHTDFVWAIPFKAQ